MSNILKKFKRVFIGCIYFFSTFIFSQSLTFNDGYIGTVGNNVQDAENILTFTTLGINYMSFSQSDTDGDGIFDTGAQGNDVPGTLTIVLSSGSIITIDNAYVVYTTNGKTKEFFGILINPDDSNNTFTNIIQYGNNALQLLAGNDSEISSSIGVLTSNSTLTLSDGGSLPQTNASSPLDDLNTYLQSVTNSDTQTPTISDQTFEIMEGSYISEGDEIAYVQASDDSGINSYSIDNGDLYSYFQINDSGWISITADAANSTSFFNDYESDPNTFILTITVEDNSGKTSSATITIDVLDDTTDNSSGGSSSETIDNSVCDANNQTGNFTLYYTDSDSSLSVSDGESVDTASMDPTFDYTATYYINQTSLVYELTFTDDGNGGYTIALSITPEDTSSCSSGGSSSETIDNSVCDANNQTGNFTLYYTDSDSSLSVSDGESVDTASMDPTFDYTATYYINQTSLVYELTFTDDGNGGYTIALSITPEDTSSCSSGGSSSETIDNSVCDANNQTGNFTLYYTDSDSSLSVSDGESVDTASMDPTFDYTATYYINQTSLVYELTFTDDGNGGYTIALSITPEDTSSCSSGGSSSETIDNSVCDANNQTGNFTLYYTDSDSSLSVSDGESVDTASMDPTFDYTATYYINQTSLVYELTFTDDGNGGYTIALSITPEDTSSCSSGGSSSETIDNSVCDANNQTGNFTLYYTDSDSSLSVSDGESVDTASMDPTFDYTATYYINQTSLVYELTFTDDGNGGYTIALSITPEDTSSCSSGGSSSETIDNSVCDANNQTGNFTLYYTDSDSSLSVSDGESVDTASMDPTFDYTATYYINQTSLVYELTFTDDGNGGYTIALSITPEDTSSCSSGGGGADTTAPIITSETTGTNLDENSGAGQTVYTITASDDSGIASYGIGGTDVSLLSVVITTGDVTLNADPDYETKSSYSFTVTATDNAGNTSASTTVTFSINDLDDTSPVVTSGSTGINLDENSGAGQTVYTITATDAVGVESYAIDGTDASLLSVNSSTGVVSLTADPDYETKSSYSFTVTASDAAGNTSASTTVTFSITDEDDTPPVVTSGTTGTNLAENSGSGQTVYTITATDAVGVESYAIDGTDASLLSVNSSTGVVSLTADPDYETNPVIVLL